MTERGGYHFILIDGTEPQTQGSIPKTMILEEVTVVVHVKISHSDPTHQICETAAAEELWSSQSEIIVPSA